MGLKKLGSLQLSAKDTAEEDLSDSCEGSREDECQDYASEDEV